ncbi:BQ2448_3359 [Microbotryum intermedium]|uniref:18S rRNA factor 2 n=1 Tax=Microbotryum intermedium TaxID=269621 RepID=A0A238FBQ9_9BASI|nr:BQ2448_3359 [Microbotryum intermedium]
MSATKKHSKTAGKPTVVEPWPQPIASTSTSTSAPVDPRFASLFPVDDDDAHESPHRSPSPHSFPQQTPLPSHLLPKSASNSNGPTPGLIYLSRIPPGMGPSKVKHVLSNYGDVGRIYLVKIDSQQAQASSSNKKRGHPKHGNGHDKHQSHRFKEGWVEFQDKRVARSVAEMLNANTIGGKKGSPWRDDVWTMKYLPKFRWDMLSEQVALERATQTSLLRFHLQHSKTEQEAYLSAVEKARVGQKIKQKRQAQGTLDEKVGGKKSKGDAGADAGEGAGGVKEKEKEGRKKSYRQRQVVDVADKVKSEIGVGQAGKGTKRDLEGVLSKLF